MTPPHADALPRTDACTSRNKLGSMESFASLDLASTMPSASEGGARGGSTEHGAAGGGGSGHDDAAVDLEHPCPICLTNEGEVVRTSDAGRCVGSRATHDALPMPERHAIGRGQGARLSVHMNAHYTHARTHTHTHVHAQTPIARHAPRARKFQWGGCLASTSVLPSRRTSA